MKYVFLLAFTLLVTACAGMIQSSSISQAYKKYEREEFEQALVLISRAENTRATTPEMKAELTYLKAQTHERLGQQAIATTLYEYLVEKHKDSQYSYLAGKKLNSEL